MSEVVSEELASRMAEIFIRAGLFVSYAEDTDRSDESEMIERQNLEKAISRVSRLAKTPLVASATQLVSKVKIDDIVYSQDTLGVDISRLVAQLKQSRQSDALKEFSQALMYTSTCVARAYREEADHHEDEFIMQSFIDRISTFLNAVSTPKDFKNMNVSPAEDTALTQISEALKNDV